MTARFQVRPLGVWGHPVTESRTPSNRFRASWDDTVRLLIFEVDRLDGDLIVVQVDADPDDIRRDGMLRSRARVDFPGVKVSFQSRHGPLTYATDAYEAAFYGDMPGWQANVRAVALSLQALRAVDRYGVTSSGEQYRGWSAISASAAEDAMTVAEAVRVMADAAGVDAADLRGADAVNRAYKVAARRAHPDAGGNADAFRLISKARDVLLAEGGTR